ncbi:MAG TPA: type VI secretion system lipoprotein TssJ [Dongiaceae bacterium]|nr:type VI secretion system lipoprotein TssJ [Dongiaceae bacterium]
MTTSFMTHLKRPLPGLVLAGLMALVLTACGTTRKALDLETTATLTITATTDVNPNSDGRAAPIVIQILKLRDERQFKQEDFLSLFQDAKGRLANDYIEMTRLKELAPGETRVEKLNLSPDVKFIGILGEYIQYDTAQAKLVIPIEAHKNNEVNVRIERLNIRLADE